MKIIHREFSFTTKSIDEEQRTAEVIASTDAVDAYGEIVVQDWDLSRYTKNPVVLWAHRSDEAPIGFAEDVATVEGKLRAKLRFVDAAASERAEQVWQGIKQGSLRAVSVGFRSKSAKPIDLNGKSVIALSGNELLEISVVPIPANPDAVIESVKQMRDLRELVESTLSSEGERGDVDAMLAQARAIQDLADKTLDGAEKGAREILDGAEKKAREILDLAAKGAADVIANTAIHLPQKLGPEEQARVFRGATIEWARHEEAANQRIKEIEARGAEAIRRLRQAKAVNDDDAAAEADREIVCCLIGRADEEDLLARLRDYRVEARRDMQTCLGRATPTDPVLRERIALLEREKVETERTELIVEARRSHRLTPHQANELANEDLAFVRRFIELQHPNPVLAAKVLLAPESGGSNAPTLNGKAWDELTYAEKHDLYHSNRDLYETMKETA